MVPFAGGGIVLSGCQSHSAVKASRWCQPVEDRDPVFEDIDPFGHRMFGIATSAVRFPLPNPACPWIHPGVTGRTERDSTVGRRQNDGERVTSGRREVGAGTLERAGGDDSATGQPRLSPVGGTPLRSRRVYRSADTGGLTASSGRPIGDLSSTPRWLIVPGRRAGIGPHRGTRPAA